MLQISMNPNYRGIAFLLSLGSLPLGCPNEKDDTDGNADTGPGTTAMGTGTTAMGTGTTATTTTEPTTTVETATSTTGQIETGGTETTVMTATTLDDTGNTGETEEPPPPTDPTCLAYASHFVECVPRYAMYQVYLAQYCESYKGSGLEQDGLACQDAIEAYFACMSTIDCAEIAMGNPCPAQAAAIDPACPNLVGDGDETSTSG